MQFDSIFGINEQVDFLHPEQTQYSIIDGIPQELCRRGQVVAVRFTEMIVFYDILSPYRGEILYNLTSESVFRVSKSVV
jgi:hypothetical protein